MKSAKQVRSELERVREWANAKIASGSEPPWAWYQYMKLRETLDAILGGMDAVTTTASSQRSASHPGGLLRLVGSNSRQDIAPLRRDTMRLRLPT